MKWIKMEDKVWSLMEDGHTLPSEACYKIVKEYILYYVFRHGNKGRCYASLSYAKKMAEKARTYDLKRKGVQS